MQGWRVDARVECGCRGGVWMQGVGWCEGSMRSSHCACAQEGGQATLGVGVRCCQRTPDQGFRY